MPGKRLTGRTGCPAEGAGRSRALRCVTRVLPHARSTTEEPHVLEPPVAGVAAGGIHGSDEHEDMIVHVVPSAEVMAMVEGGRIVSANTLVPMLWRRSSDT